MNGKPVYTTSHMETGALSTWLEIDLNAIRHNVTRLRQITGRNVMAVVKANGYGHGLAPAAQAAVQAGATWLGVARIEEALTLRRVGLVVGILVLGYVNPGAIHAAVTHNISVNLYDQQLVDEYSRQLAGQTGKLRVHVKLDTGMGRLGIRPEDAVGFFKDLVSHPELAPEGLFTHFARSDEPLVQKTRQQLDRFEAARQALASASLLPPLVHAANSAAALYFPDAYYDLVRSGIAIYGLHPSPDAPLPADFRPALTWKARLTSVKTLPAGHSVSYGTSYTTTRPSERIGAIGVGYADGFRRQVRQEVLLHGKRVPVIGRICMDQSMLQIDSLPNARPGDEVVLIGQQGRDRITIEEIASRWNTNNYEMTCGLAHRLPRLYFDGELNSAEG
jgi:alanine racemase